MVGFFRMTSKYTKSARGQECQVRIPRVCNHNPETVVFAHLNGGGMGMKRPDIHGAYACSNCHDYVDLRNLKGVKIHPQERARMFLEGVIRTQEIMIRDGILKL